MLIIPLILLSCRILICCSSHMSAFCLPPAVSALQLLQSGILSPALQMCTSLDTFRHHLKTHYFHYFQQAFQPTWHLPLARQIRFRLTIVRVYKLYLLTYLHRRVPHQVVIENICQEWILSCIMRKMALIRMVR